MNDFQYRPEAVTASVCLTPHQIFENALRDIARATTPNEVERAGNKAMDRFDTLQLVGQIDLAQAGEWAMQIYHKATDTLLLIREAEKRAADVENDQGGQ